MFSPAVQKERKFIFVMYVLVVNAGSSSLKYQLFDMDTREVIAKGLCERIGIDGKFTHQAAGEARLSPSRFRCPPTRRRRRRSSTACSDEETRLP